MDKKYTQEFFLSAGETDAEGQLSLPLLTSKMIDISTAHANSMGIGNPAMEARGCGWVLSRLAMEMASYPRVNETYCLSTWIETWNRHFSERIIEVSSPDGRKLGYARTIWMVLDTRTRESVGLGHLDIPDDIMVPDGCPIPRQGKHVLVVPEDFVGEPGRGAVRANMPEFDYVIKYCDLDFYRHVNTVRYVQLLVNRFTLEEWDRMEVARMEIAFMRELRFGQTVKVLRADADEDSLFSLMADDSGEPAMFARLTRRPR